MKKIIPIILIAICYSNINAQVKKVLFLGNSYTYANDLPQLTKNIALSFGDTIYSEQNTPGGYTYNLHTTNSITQTRIQAQLWDYVILQEQSQIPSLPQSITLNDYSVPHSVTLNNMIKANHHCTETVFYMTWGRKNGDASFCGQHPPVCTYKGMQQELRNTYMFMADTNKATISPVGVAWNRLRDNFPLIELYQVDESHPSVHGSYLAACVFYATLYQKSPIGSTYFPIGINATEALNIQTIASGTVLDSLPQWRINANKPIANFNYSGTGTINFNSTSTNGMSYYWDFGDGNNSTQEHPNNTYLTSGNFNVQLIVFSSDSCFSDTITQTINVINTSIINVNKKNDLFISPNPANNYINIESSLEYTSATIIDVTGKKIQTTISKKINISELKKGVYFLQVFNHSSHIRTIKFLKQ